MSAPRDIETTPLDPIVVPARRITPLIEMAAARGVRVSEIFEGLGIAATTFEHPQNPVQLADYYRIQNQISAALEDETCQLSTRQLLPGTNDFILSQMSDVTSLFEAMKVIARSYNLLHGGEFNSVRKRGDVVTFVIDDKGFPYAIKDNEEFIAFSIECVLIFLHCMLKVVAPDHADRALRKITVTRAQRDETAQHLAAWSAPIKFGAPTYSIDYDGELATSRIKPPAPDMLTAAHVHAEIISVAERNAGIAMSKRTEDFVRSALERGVIDQTRVAALLGVSTATLRRRLEDEGVTFRELRRDVLNDASKKLLKRGLGVSEVAEELGFSDFRSFNRAFKSWNGETPATFSQRFNRKAN